MGWVGGDRRPCPPAPMSRASNEVPNKDEMHSTDKIPNKDEVPDKNELSVSF